MKSAPLLILTSVATLILWVSACDILRNPLPETARIEITSQNADEAELIMSLNFLTGRQAVEEDGLVIGDTTIVQFLHADTLQITLPYSSEHDIKQRHRFFAQLNIPDEESDHHFRMRVWIDGDQRYDATSDEQVDGALKFLYYFRAGEDIIIRPQP